MPPFLSQNARRKRLALKNVSSRVVFVRILSSAVVWTLLWLGAADLFLHTYRPLHDVKMGGYVPRDRSSISYKLSKLEEPWTNPDLVVIGSSLSQSSFACADALAAKRRAPYTGYELHSYGKSVYLQDKLSQLTGKKLSAVDMSVSGCMASDAYHLLKRAIAIRPHVRSIRAADCAA